MSLQHKKAEQLSGRLRATTRAIFVSPYLKIASLRFARRIPVLSELASGREQKGESNNPHLLYQRGPSPHKMASDADAVARVSAFLSDSRLFAEKATRCKNKNCAYLCTGIAPAHCCKVCARTPNQHGPRCLKKLLPCSRPGCGYAVTGLAPSHCCRKCANGEDHGPSCWLMPVPVAVESDEEDDQGADEMPSGGDQQRLLCVPVDDPQDAPLAAAAKGRNVPAPYPLRERSAAVAAGRYSGG